MAADFLPHPPLSVVSAGDEGYSAYTLARLVPVQLVRLFCALPLTLNALVLVETRRSKLWWIGRRPSANLSSHHLSYAIT